LADHESKQRRAISSGSSMLAMTLSRPPQHRRLRAGEVGAVEHEHVEVNSCGMAKEEAMQMEGTVVETLRNTTFRVELENGQS
jgi:hypothetical protein